MSYFAMLCDIGIKCPDHMQSCEACSISSYFEVHLTSYTKSLQTMQKYPILQNELHRPLNFLRDDVEFNETTKSVLERINIK